MSLAARPVTPPAAWWMAAVFALAGFVSYTDRLILGALVDPIRGELGVTDSQVSLLQGAAFAVVYVVAGLVLGRLADRRRRLTIIGIGSAVWCLGTVACGLAPGFWSLFAARLVVGVGEAALAPAAVSMIADRFPPHRRGLAIGIFVMGTIVGGPAAIGIGGGLLAAAQAGAFAAWPLADGLSPWRAVLVLTGVGGMIVPLLCLTLREPPRLETVGGHTPLPDVVRRLGADWKLLAPLYLGMALLCVGDYGLLSWLPTDLSRAHHLRPAEIGAVFGVVTTVSGVLGAVLGGQLSDGAERLGGVRARVTLAAACSAAGVGAALLVGLGHLSASYSGLAIWTFVSAVAGITGIAAIQRLVANEFRGVGMSLVSFFNTLLGLGLGPSMVALTSERILQSPGAIGQAIALVVAPCAALAGILFWLSRRAAADARKATA